MKKMKIAAAAFALLVTASCGKNIPQENPPKSAGINREEPLNKENAQDAKPFGIPMLPGIKAEARVLSDTVFMVTLSEPVPFFEEMLTLPQFLLYSDDPRNAPKYSGAFKTVSVENGTIVLEKNKNHFDEKNVKLQKIYIETTDDITNIINKMNSGEIQIACDLPAVTEDLKKRSDFYAKPLSQTVFLHWNIASPKHPFDNLLVRKALVIAINRQELSLLTGDFIPAEGIVPYGAIRSDGVDFREYNTQNEDFFDSDIHFGIQNAESNLYEAKALLDFAGIAPETLTINLLCEENNAASETAAEFLRKSWAKLNVKVIKNDKSVKPENITVFIKNVKNPMNDPLRILKPLQYYCSNAEFSGLVSEAGSSPKTETGFLLLHKAEKIAKNDFSASPLLFGTKSYLAEENAVKNYFIDTNGMKYFRLVSKPSSVLSVCASAAQTDDLTAANTSAGLFRKTPEGKTESELAENFTVSEDGLKYIFRLRENQKWSDGSPVTAQDFVNSWYKHTVTDGNISA